MDNEYIDFEEAIKIIKNKLDDEPINLRTILIEVLNDNDWFDLNPERKDEKTYINKNQFEIVLPQILFCLGNKGKSASEKIINIIAQYRPQFPLTVTRLQRFIAELKVDEAKAYSLISFVLSSIKKEIFDYDDGEVQSLLEKSYNEETIISGNVFIAFLGYIQKHYEVLFKTRVMEMKQRALPNYSTSINFDELFLQLFFLLTNPKIIESKKLFYYAYHNKTTCDAWLYILLHYITAQRDTDLLRIPHPQLSDKPESIKDKILYGEFEDAEAEKIIIQYESYYNYLMPRPNKTQNRKNTPAIQFHFPKSLRVLFGKLFALAEAHFQVYEIPKDEPLIRRITDYKQIKNYLGDEIGELFLKADFNARAMNKAYMQQIYQIAVMAYDQYENPQNSYLIASSSRSHKISALSLPEITSLYIKPPLKLFDLQKMLFERGILSLETKMTIEILTNGASRCLPEVQQTQLMKAITLTPHQQESFMKLYNEAYDKAEKIVKSIFVECGNDKDKIITMLQSIAIGEAPSKTDGILCFKTGMGKPCPFPERGQCLFCEYHILTKSIAIVIAKEISLHKKKIKELDLDNNRRDFEKHDEIIIELMKVFSEILIGVKEEYGEEALETMKEIIREVLSAYEQ